MAFYELSQYTIRPGKMDDWLRLMDEVIIPLQVEKGMVVTGSFCSLNDENKYLGLCRFENEDVRTLLYAEFYESDAWKNELTSKVDECVERQNVEIISITPTSRSVLQ